MSQQKLLAIKSALNYLHSSYRDGDQCGRECREGVGAGAYGLFEPILG